MASPLVGEVVQVGPGKHNDDGTRQTPEVSIGDKVFEDKNADGKQDDTEPGISGVT